MSSFKNLFHFRSAVRAAGSVVRNGALAEGAQTRSLCRSRLFLLAEVVDHLDEEEDAQCHQQEVNDILNEGAVCEHSRVLALAQNDLQRGEIDTAGNQRQQRHEQVVDNRGDDAAECAADHNADSHVNDIALECKLLEFLDELLHK